MGQHQAQIIFNSFPDLTNSQKAQFEALEDLYREWNEMINIVSRKDIDHLYVRHVLHSLGIAKVNSFEPGTRILDIGTGGGFPGIPLAILFPESQFLLVDSIGKKIKVVNAVAEAINLTNLSAIHERAEKVKGKFDFVVSRAVARTKMLYQWTHGKLIADTDKDKGFLLLKGGDLDDELEELNRPYSITELSNFFDDPFFETKKVAFIPM